MRQQAKIYSAMSGIDAIDRKILTALQRDGRISNLKLAEAVSLSPTAVLARTQRLIRDGYILGFEARLNPAKLDSGMTVFVEVLLDRDSPQGTWTLAGGTIHHLALNTGNEENQMKLRAHIEGLGFTDISEQKDRNYFRSVYFREPGRVLFEIATDVPGFAIDEPLASLGQSLKLPSQYETRRGEIEQVLPAVA